MLKYFPKNLSDKTNFSHFMWNLKNDTNESIYETETKSRTWRIDWWLPRGRVWERDGFGVLDKQMQNVIYRMEKQQGPTI